MKKLFLSIVLSLASFGAIANGGVYIGEGYQGDLKYYIVSGSITDIAQKNQGAYLTCKSNLFYEGLYCYAKNSYGKRASCHINIDYAKASRILGTINSSSSIYVIMYETGGCRNLTVTNGSSYLNGFFR